MRVATDVGGTFTDLIYCTTEDDPAGPGILRAVKVDTTPPDFERGVLSAIERAEIPPHSFLFFAHGSLGVKSVSSPISASHFSPEVMR